MTLSNTIKQIAGETGEANNPVRLLDADVVSQAPLRIRLRKNDKLVLPEERFIIPEKLTDYTVTVRTPRGTETQTIMGALKIGDELVVASLQGGGRYFIMDRIRK